MKVLKTVVATAVIVFALTTAAVAGVQHVTRQGSQAGGAQARQAPAAITVTLTAEQFARLLDGQGRTVKAREVHEARTTQRARKAHSPRHTRGHASDGRAESHETRSSAPTSHTQVSSGGTHHAETGHSTGEGHSGGSHSGGSHAGGGHE